MYGNGRLCFLSKTRQKRSERVLAVPITDVMVNARILAVIQIVAAPRRGPLLVELMGLEPMTNELEVHCSPN